MSLTLSTKDHEMLRGGHGKAAKMAMTIVTRMAEVTGARELLDITGAHIDSTVYIGDAGLEFAERLAGLGAKGPIDVVQIFRRSDEVGPIVEQAIAAGAKAVWMQLGISNEEAAAVAHAAGLDVVMNQCMKVQHSRLSGETLI